VLKALKSLLEFVADAAQAPRLPERRPLDVAIASLLNEALRIDASDASPPRATAVCALQELCGLDAADAQALLAETRDRAARLTSYFRPVGVIKRGLPLASRVRFVEQLWRVAYANGRLDPVEDQFVRKIADLLYVPNTQSMLARNQARGGDGSSER
jgi:uncharacterized tellurite resistance protein B-like protein